MIIELKLNICIVDCVGLQDHNIGGVNLMGIMKNVSIL